MDRCRYCGARKLPNYDAFDCGTRIGEKPMQAMRCRIADQNQTIDQYKIVLQAYRDRLEEQSELCGDLAREVYRLQAAYDDLRGTL